MMAGKRRSALEKSGLHPFLDYIPVTEFGQKKGHALAYNEIISLCTWWSGQSYALVIKEMSKTAQIAKSVKMA